jgi:hypothetical protein
MTTTKSPWRARPALFVIASLLSASVASAKGPEAPADGAPAPSEGTAEQPAPAGQPSAGEICSSAYERAQTEKLAGHYVAATAAALECSQLMCNTAIVRECERFYTALEQDTPTLVFSARKAEGGELAGVRVEMDGQLAAEQITGRPYAVDPGSHTFVFTHPELGTQQITEVARVGDHARVLEVTFTDPNAKPADAGVVSAPPRNRTRSGVPAMTYVLGGVGVAALGAFVYFRVSGVNDYNDYNATCSPYCRQDDVDAVRQKFLLSYVSLGVGIASVAGAGLVYAFRPYRDSAPVQASIVPHGDGAIAGIRTTF